MTFNNLGIAASLLKEQGRYLDSVSWLAQNRNSWLAPLIAKDTQRPPNYSEPSTRLKAPNRFFITSREEVGCYPAPSGHNRYTRRVYLNSPDAPAKLLPSELEDPLLLRHNDL
jgi:hypothetical protein